jgi:hypothetical protein
VAVRARLAENINFPATLLNPQPPFCPLGFRWSGPHSERNSIERSDELYSLHDWPVKARIIGHEQVHSEGSSARQLDYLFRGPRLSIIGLLSQLKT